MQQKETNGWRMETEDVKLHKRQHFKYPHFIGENVARKQQNIVFNSTYQDGFKLTCIWYFINK